MAISNGFDETRILPVLIQRKGWLQPSEFPTLDAANLTCKSGKPFSQHHALCTLRNIMDTQENKDLANSATNTNAYLTALNTSVCMEALQAVFTKEAVIDQPQMTCEKECNSQLIEVANIGRFVGMRIKIAEGNHAVQISRLALIFNGVATFTVYLYNDLKKAAIKTKTVTTANDQTFVDLDEWVLRPIDSSAASRTFYLGYYQDDVETSNPNCKAYDYGIPDWEEAKIYGVSGIEANVLSPDFDRVNVYVSDRVYGLTAEMSSYRDYSNTIVQRAADFDQLIGDLMARNVIEGIVYTTRSNKNQRITEEKGREAYTDLNQAIPTEESPFVPGLKARISKEIKRLQDSFDKKHGITIGTPC